jgi:hypothetical protein
MFEKCYKIASTFDRFSNFSIFSVSGSGDCIISEPQDMNLCQASRRMPQFHCEQMSYVQHKTGLSHTSPFEISLNMSHAHPSSRLPAGWIEMRTPDGKTTFFYHHPTGTSHWTLPAPPLGSPPPHGQKQKDAPSRGPKLERPPGDRATRAPPESPPAEHRSLFVSSDAPLASTSPQTHARVGSGPRTKTLFDLSVHEVSLLMLGSDHTKYAEAMKQHKIKGIVLASATDDELNVIFRDMGVSVPHMIELRALVASWKSDPAKVQRVIEVGRPRAAAAEEHKRDEAAKKAAAAEARRQRDAAAAACSAPGRHVVRTHSSKL